MARFKNYLSVPPSRKWFYEDPETGIRFETKEGLDLLVEQVYSFYGQTKTREEVKKAIEEYMCSQLPRGFCDDDQVGKIRIDTSTLLQATSLFVSRLKSFFSREDFFVSKEEASRRATICKTCPMNSWSFCGSCRGISDLYVFLLRLRKNVIPEEKWLQYCLVCGCLLKAKVHVVKTYLLQAETRLTEYPSHCWMVEKDEN